MTKSFLILIFSCFLFAVSYSQQPQFQWAIQGVDSLFQGGDLLINGSIVDNSGNIYVTGSFKGVADFDPSSGTTNVTSVGLSDVFLAKYNSVGSLVWVKSMGGILPDVGNSVAMDGSGNLIIIGSFYGTADFDPSAGVLNITSVGNRRDAFLAKYDNNGALIWAGGMAGTGDGEGSDVAIDASGNILVTGTFLNVTDFDLFSGTTSLTATVSGAENVFLAKYTGNGSLLWVNGIAGDSGESIALDNSGNPIITGVFWNTVDFDPSPATFNLTSAGITDVFLAKYLSNGSFVWANAIGGTTDENAGAVACSPSGNIALTGSFTGTVDFDPSAIVLNKTSVGYADVFLTNYDANGSLLWANTMGGANFEGGSDLLFDASENVILTGSFNNTLDLDPSASVLNVTSLGFSDVYLAKYNSATGALSWGKSIGGVDADGSSCISKNSSGSVFIGGTFTGVSDFDPSAATANLNAPSTISTGFVAKYSGFTGSYTQAYKLGTYSFNQQTTSASAPGDNGSVYVTGEFNGTVDFDPSGGFANRTSNGATDFFLAKYAGNNSLIWAISIGGAGNDQVNAVTVDAAGNVYVTGTFSGTVDFDPSSGVTNASSNGVNSDMFLAKYSSSGSLIWAKGIGGTYEESGIGIATDNTGNILLTGYFQTTVDFDPSPATTNLTTVAGTDVFIAKYDTDGSLIWAKGIGGTNAELPSDVVVDASGNTIITGYHSGTTDFDPSSGTSNLASVGGKDIFLAKYDVNGLLVWAKNIGGTGAEESNGMVLDVSGNIIITGHFSGTVDFDPSASVLNVASTGCQTIFIAKYTNNGLVSWAKAINMTTIPGSYCSSSDGRAVAVDASGNVFVTGHFLGTLDFDPSTATLVLSSSNDNIFLAKYTSSGLVNWAKNIGGAENFDSGESLVVSTSGKIILSGNFSQTVDFDPGVGVSNLFVPNELDFFVASYLDCNTSAPIVNAAQSFCVVASIADLGASGSNIEWYSSLIGGSPLTGSTALINNTTYYAQQTLNGCVSNNRSAVTVTLNPNTIGTDIQTACDSYTWIDSNTYTSSTSTPTFVLQNAAGCDSTVTLNLTITHSNSGTDIQTACDSFDWIDGNTYISSTNTPTFVLQNAAGCDSTVTLNLTITNSTTGTDIQTACDSFDWIDGNTYMTSTNTPTVVLQNAAGCDSIVTLNLTITHSNTGTDVQTVCDSFDWIDGNTYTSSTNTPTFVLQNAAGCDSIVTLNLTITHSNTGTDIQTACDSFDWIDGNTYTSSTNIPTFVLQNAAGCDSIVTLNLTITHSNTGTDIQTACDSFDWIDGNTYTSSTNTPTFVLQNAAGCDSIVTLNLTITHSNSGTDIQTACDSFDWIDGNTYTSSTNTPTFVLQNAAGCDSIVTLNLTITHSNTGTDVQTVCDSFDWIDGNTYTSSTNTPTFVLQNAAGCDSTVTLNLTIIPSLPLVVENVFVFPSDANSCVGEAAIDLSGNADFELDFDNGSQIVTSNGYSLVTNLCPGVHDLHVTDNCGDTLTTQVVIPIDSNFVFNNPFIDSLALDSLGVTMTNCDIYYAGIDTAYIDSIWAIGNTVNVVWNIVDSNGSNFDTTSYVLNNGNGVYWLQLSVFCPNKSLGEYFTVTEAIYFNNGHVSTAGLKGLDQNSFEIYPNPTNNQVHISFSGSDSELTVYDVQGKVVLKDKIQNQEIISLQNFERGVYLFDLRNSQGHCVQRVVKQ